MENLFIYLIKSSGLIALFYLAYMLLLRKETFFSGNRWFLLFGLITASVLPLFFITKIVWVEPTTEAFDWSNIPVTNLVIAPEPEINWYVIATAIYCLGIVISLLKLLFDFYSLIKILKGKTIHKKANFKFVDLNENISPFSYFNYIVYNSSLYNNAELENILEHEKIHSQQKHSMDILISRLFCVVFWFHPIIWLYKKAIAQNLEFIADNEAAKKITDKKNYQLTLLKITTQENCVAITNHFYESLIKKRIIMLNQNQSKKWNSWKYALIFPALVAFVFLFQIKTVAQEKETDKVAISEVQNEIFNVIITKNTTDEEIKQQCEKAKKLYDIDLRFFNIKRNSNGEIIKIESEYKDKENGGGTAIAHELDNKAIKPFKFFHDDDKKVNGYNMDFNLVNNKDSIDLKSFKVEKDLTNLSKGKEIYINGEKSSQEELDKLNSNDIERIDVAKINNKEAILVTKKFNRNADTLSNEEKPLIILDGHRNHKLKVEDIQNIDPNSIEQITVLKDKDATNKYGEEGKNGVIEITTKEKIGKNGFSTKGYKLKSDTKSNTKQEIQVIGFKAGSWSGKTNQQKTVFDGEYLNREKILVIVDGKKSKTAVSDINPDAIESINVLKDKSAEDKYGEDGKNGVIEITTKEKAATNKPQVIKQGFQLLKQNENNKTEIQINQINEESNKKIIKSYLKDFYIDDKKSTAYEYHKLDINNIEKIETGPFDKKVKITTKKSNSRNSNQISEKKTKSNIENTSKVIDSTESHKIFNNALVIIDGKKSNYENLLKIKNRNIKFTNAVIFEESTEESKKIALATYGEKARNGVLVVETSPLIKKQLH